MCWIGKGPAKIAERDIVVYKLGYVIEATKEFRSLYQNYTYYPKELNKVVTLVPVIYTTEVSKLQPSETGMIYEGYHSYKSMSLPFNGLEASSRVILLGTIIKERISICNSYYIATFIIPKGSEYYESIVGELVSSSIIYTGKYVKI